MLKIFNINNRCRIKLYLKQFPMFKDCRYTGNSLSFTRNPQNSINPVLITDMT